MNHDNTTSTSNINRERMIQMLNKDLACEYKAIIAFIVYSQVLKRAAYADIARELELHAAEDFQHAKQIAKQIDALGGTPCVRLNTVKSPKEPVAVLLASIFQNLESEIDLASLLDIGEAHTDALAPASSSKQRPTRVSPTGPKSFLPNHQSVRRTTARSSAGNTSAWAMSQPA